ncbi:MAG TPA: hemerythrin domain-containing protein [Phycisphaerales bacterium]|nr:hemerythrin domain-containing protein [Phycisphaerales bacterium]
MEPARHAARTPPLHRHAALQPLSREHMSGLIQARNLQRAAGEGRGACVRAAAEFVRVWQAEIVGHFDDEERLLVPLIDDPASRERLVREHREIRALADRCRAVAAGEGVQPEALARLGTLLHDHIRWEERALFEAIQRDHPDALAAMLDHAEEIERVRPGARRRRTFPEGGKDGKEGGDRE